MLRKLLAEPLLHFLLLGLGLFMLYRAVNPGSAADRTIIVDDATVAMLAQRYASVWMRPPTPAELQGLVDTFIRDEVLYREGLALGLDRNDPVIQRRVLQKLEVLNEETDTSAPPTDAELQEYLRANAARHAVPPAFSFVQVLFDPARRGAGLETAVQDARVALDAGADPAGLGDRSLLPVYSDTVPLDRIARDYGPAFAQALAKLPAGSWQGPVRSDYGLHLVRISSSIAARAPTLAEVREAVERDWENDRRIKAREARYQELLQDYSIQLDADLAAAGAERAVQGAAAR